MLKRRPIRFYYLEYLHQFTRDSSGRFQSDAKAVGYAYALAELLGIPDDEAGAAHLKMTVVGQRVTELSELETAFLRSSSEDDYRAVQRARARIWTLIRDLGRFRDAKPDDYKRFIDRWIVGDYEPGNYFGARHELHIASKLIELGVDFTMPQERSQPDFHVIVAGRAIRLECTSCIFNDAARKNGPEAIRSKLLDKLEEKLGKTYVGPSTALIFDTTNINADATEDETLRNWEVEYEVLKTCQSERREKRFGVLVAQSWNHDAADRTLLNVVTRHIEEEADPRLVELVKRLCTDRPLSLGSIHVTRST